MAGKRPIKNDSDSIDISELAALNNDISDDLIEQLSQQISGDAASFENASEKGEDDASLFEEPVEEAPEAEESPAIEVADETDTALSDEKTAEQDSLKNEPEASPAVPENVQGPAAPAKKEDVKFDSSFDDNFVKKYKAKLSRQALGSSDDYADNAPEDPNKAIGDLNEPIEKISKGNIAERAMTQAQKEYNDSLDFLDGNVKYSKYVIYIDPQNVDFIESLTVKERKNLINKIIREQDDIAITKRRFNTLQTVIRHSIVAILTIAIFIPVFYYVFNASLEATIDNYRRSQTNWQTLYREKGKITRN